MPIRGKAEIRNFCRSHPCRNLLLGRSGLGVLMDLDRRPALVSGVADVFEWALDAARLPRDADATSMPDQLMGEVDPLLARDDPHQVLLDLLRRVARGEFETTRKTIDVSVHYDAFGFFEPGTEDDVSGFAGDAGK